jgi:hypothetical protein
MAYSNPGNPGPVGDYFDDGAAATAEPKMEEGEQKGGEQTAVVPKSLCPGMKPGDEMVVKIDRVEEDSYIVSYAPEKGESEEHEPTEEAAPAVPPKPPGAMDEMMS